jgi:hypothetical protein
VLGDDGRHKVTSSWRAQRSHDGGIHFSGYQSNAVLKHGAERYKSRRNQIFLLLFFKKEALSFALKPK